MSTKLVAKLSLIGESKVGKTSIRRNYFGETFKTSLFTTLGADFAIRRESIDDFTSIEFQIWDMSGQIGFQTLVKKFLASTTGAILVFDLTSKESLGSLEKWLELLWDAGNPKTIPIALIGNKVDLREDISVTKEDVEQFLVYLKEKTESTWISYYETSAKTGENIDKFFSDLTKKIIEDYVENSLKAN